MNSTSPGPAQLFLTIVIPALDEEGAIASIIQRCLSARSTIRAEGGVEGVEIVVVSDGSTDRTSEIAATFSDIDLIVFPKNRGYGAAIQAGWRAHPNEILGFLDADGTCDPLTFAPMCAALQREHADIVLGSRMGPGSRMPGLRRLGNSLYAALLRWLSNQPVQDTASGMRVVRRSALPRLLPLPEGLHFTPAMSARALLENLRIIEMPMTYEERVGSSKLHVVRDGFRFLNIILSTTLFVRPSRLLLPLAAGLVVTALAMMVGPSAVYFRERSVEDWLIYRFLLSGLLVGTALLLAGATYIMEQFIAAGRGTHERLVAEGGEWWTSVSESRVALFGVASFVAGVLLVWPAIISYLTTARVNLHWSRVVVAMFCELLAAEISVVLMLNRIARGVARQQAAWLAALHMGQAE